jgi:hypothetical protein
MEGTSQPGEDLARTGRVDPGTLLRPRVRLVRLVTQEPPSGHRERNDEDERQDPGQQPAALAHRSGQPGRTAPE